MTKTVDYADMQGLLRFGFKHLDKACFLLLRVKERSAARAWLAAAPLTSAADAKPPPMRALQVALSCEGLCALGIGDEIVNGFSNEFVMGMSADPSRSRRLGDIAANDPAHWAWGASNRQPHVLLMLYASAAMLADYRHAVRAECSAGFDEIACLETTELDEFEPFGFRDGLSQPGVDWQRQRPVEDKTQYAYSNLASLGEFVLGYPNEYGMYTDRPLLDSAQAAAADLPRAEEAPDKADLGRNGTYLVLRQLQQDVPGFWRYLDTEARGDATLRAALAAAMVGRKIDGTPLVDPGPRAPSDNAALPSNNFSYADDPQGLQCPLGAHIRRNNPRNADLPAGGSGALSRLARILGFNAQALDVDHVASTRFHRLLRRGRKYGPNINLAQALTLPSGSQETGLHFICLNANIGRQFEFVQAAWIAGTKFDGLAGEGDPLLGHRQPLLDGTRTDEFSIPQANGPDRRLCAMPSFVAVRGGAYFFLPGLRALRYLVTA